MKITMIVQAVGLASMLGSQGMASPAIADGEASILTARTALHDVAKEAVELEKRYIPIGYNIDSVNQVSSEILAAQLEGAATSLKQLRDACANAPALTKRLATQNVNTTFITETICNAAKKHALPSNSDVLNKTVEARSLLWAVQAIPACGYNFKFLCNLISVEGANQIGLDGNLVKSQICGVGG